MVMAIQDARARLCCVVRVLVFGQRVLVVAYEGANSAGD